MATTGWRTPDPVIRELATHPWRFEFHQAVRLLEWVLDGDRVGFGSDARTEAIRFRALPNLSFPASELDEVRIPEADSGAQSEVTVTFMGLATAMGPLPRPVVERILERVARKDPGFRDFLDIFHHRLIAYHYRGREKHRPAMRWVGPEESILAEPLLALAGLGSPALRNRLELPDRSLLGLGATLGRPRTIATGLAGTVAHYFGIPTRDIPFQGRWHALSPDLWTRLTARPPAQARPAGLGHDSVLGTRAWDQAAAFELRLGPLNLATFLSLLPGDPRRRIADGARLAPLRSLVRLQAPVGVEMRARLVLDGKEAPRLPITSHPKGPRLGYTAWLGTPPADRALDHVTLPLG
jgi:type VI secretion system protein ImpH